MNKCDEIKKYIGDLKIPRYHKISISGEYLKLSHQDLYLSGDIVFSNFDKVTVINITKFQSIKAIIDRFISNAKERIKSRPYQIQLLDDIDNIGYVNIWDFQYSDDGKKDRYLNGEGRCDY